MEGLIKDIYKQFCKETKRFGRVLVAPSITEQYEYLTKKLKEYELKRDKKESI